MNGTTGERRLRLAVLAAVAAWLAPAAARSAAQVAAALDRPSVAAGEPFRLTLNVTGAGGDVGTPRFPGLPGVEYHGGSRAQTMQIVNGVVSSSVTLTFTVIARQPGRLVLQGIQVPVDGGTVTPNPVEIAVGQPAARQPGGAAQAGDPPAFVVSNVNKRVVHVGEQLVHALRLNHRVRFGSQVQYAPPSFSGFITEPLDASPRPDKPGYAAMEVRTALFPTAPGTYTLAPATLQFVMIEADNGDPFSAFFGGGRNVTLKSDPIQVVVKPLPDAGKPAGFTGGVGSYRLSASLDKTTVDAGKPVTLTLEISGKGLVKSLKEPAMPEIPGMRRYETITALSTKAMGDAIQGTKTFKVMLIPHTSGKITIPAITYPVFNPASGGYETLRSTPLALAVRPGTGGPQFAGPTGADATAAGGIRTVHADIRFLKPVTRPGGSSPPRAWPGPGFLAAQALPLIFLCAGLVVAWRRDVVNRDPAKARSRTARRNAVRKLAAAKAAAGRTDAGAVHETVQQALAEYLADRWNVSGSGLTLNAIQQRLRSAGMPDASLTTLAAFWEEADLVRYAPQAATATDLAGRLRETERLLADLERWT